MLEGFLLLLVVLKPDAVLGLATGSTPVGTYKQLIKGYEEGTYDFSQIKSVNLDEYKGLPGDHDQSYRYFMNTNLFDHINIDKSNTNVPKGIVDDGEAECERYNQLIKDLGGIDLQLLGIGGNAHIGFNEPCDEFVKGTQWVFRILCLLKRFFYLQMVRQRLRQYMIYALDALSLCTTKGLV